MLEVPQKKDFHRIILSAKSTDINETIEVYERLAATFSYPLHVGLTEAGEGFEGIIKSTIALGTILQKGIGNNLSLIHISHPNWKMGTKITIDSANLINKGLEVIEANCLFRFPYSQIDAVSYTHLDVYKRQDANIIRINVPPLTEERRKEIAKFTKKTAEEAKVAIRNLRREANEGIKKLEKDGVISEDESKKSVAEAQKMTDEFINEIDGIWEKKEKEIMSI